MTFRDKGPGISKEILDKLTVSFFSTKPADEGTGLGLNISSNIVSDHGGTLAIKSIEGEFTEVIVELPAAIVHSENENIALKNGQTGDIKGKTL